MKESFFCQNVPKIAEMKKVYGNSQEAREEGCGEGDAQRERRDGEDFGGSHQGEDAGHV